MPDITPKRLAQLKDWAEGLRESGWTAAGDNAFELLDALAAITTERATLRYFISLASEHRDELEAEIDALRDKYVNIKRI